MREQRERAGQFRVGTWVSGLRQQEINCKDTWPRLSEGAQPRRQDPSIKRDCPMPRGSAIVDCYENDRAGRLASQAWKNCRWLLPDGSDCRSWPRRYNLGRESPTRRFLLATNPARV